MSGLPPVRPLFAEDLEELCAADVAAVRKSLESRPRGSNTAVALLPNIDTVRWHHAREDFVGHELQGRAPKVKGAMVGTEKGKRVWCYWTRMWYNSNPAEAEGNTLHILRLVIEDGSWEETTSGHTHGYTNGHTNHHNGNQVDNRSNGRQNSDSIGRSLEDGHVAAIAGLMAMAQREADEWKMEHVELWTPSATSLAAAQSLYPAAKLTHRDTESIASLMWYPEHDGPVADKIDWIANEKYGWC